MRQAQDPGEMLPVVDDQDRVIGVETRSEIHRKGLMHRAVHVLVFDPRRRLYLQKRSMQKDTHPGKWTSSASGHVDPDEGYDQAAQRELGEELGLEARPRRVAMLRPAPELENEFSAVYELVTERAPAPDPVEIMEGRFFSLDEAVRLAVDRQLAAPCLALVIAAWQSARPAGRL